MMNIYNIQPNDFPENLGSVEITNNTFTAYIVVQIHMKKILWPVKRRKFRSVLFQGQSKKKKDHSARHNATKD